MHSPLATPSATREVLERHGLALKHHLGQNFLVSQHVIERIGELADLSPEDVVLEVGPGIGTLTCALLGEGCRVLAIEADRTLPPVLAETCADGGERLRVLEGDALKVDLRALEPAPTKLVSNLPYQVAATVVLRAFEELPSVGRAVVMVQAEVADRMAAHPGTKAYGAYTAKLGLYAQVTGRFEVGPGNFMPPPHVDSAVVRIDRAASSLAPDELAFAARVIDAAFAQRRKTIRNSMSASGFDKAALDKAFEAAGIAPGARAETLEPADFVRLAGELR